MSFLNFVLENSFLEFDFLRNFNGNGNGKARESIFETISDTTYKLVNPPPALPPTLASMIQHFGISGFRVQCCLN